MAIETYDTWQFRTTTISLQQVESQVKHRQIHGIHKFYIASIFRGVFKLLLKTEFLEVSDCATP